MLLFEKWEDTNTNSSSTRSWGVRVFVGFHPIQMQFIPTHVGFARRNTTVHSTDMVHPHARGVCPLPADRMCSHPRFIPTHVGFAFAVVSMSVVFSGSSPRTWGLRFPCSSRHSAGAVDPHAGGGGRRIRCHCASA